MIAAVFDCVVFVQAVLSNKGPAFACLNLAEEEHVELHFCPSILDELKRSLDSSTLRKKYSQITDESLQTFLERVTIAGILVENPPAVFSLSRDPKDEQYLDLAIEMRVPFLVTRDKDLLDLMKDDVFRQTYPWLSILDPVAFLTHVRNELAMELGGEADGNQGR